MRFAPNGRRETGKIEGMHTPAHPHLRCCLRGLVWFSVVLVVAGCASLPSWREREAFIDPIPQARWGGTPVDASRPGWGRSHTISRITLHHGGVAFGRDKDVAQHLRNLQSWSRRDKGWIDIPYHYVIDLDGRVYEARDIRFAGDTNTEYDPTGHALIMVLGNYEDAVPNAAQIEATVLTMAMIARRHRLTADVIASHRDFSKQTACPGRHLYQYVQDGSLVKAVRALL